MNTWAVVAKMRIVCAYYNNTFLLSLQNEIFAILVALLLLLLFKKYFLLRKYCS